MMHERTFYGRILDRNFNKLLVMIEQKKCIKKKVSKKKIMVTLLGKRKIERHNECNINLSVTKKIPVVFYNFQNNNLHLIL